MLQGVTSHHSFLSTVVLMTYLYSTHKYNTWQRMVLSNIPKHISASQLITHFKVMGSTVLYKLTTNFFET